MDTQTLTHDNKQIKVLHGGKVVVVFPLNNDKVIIPFFCPVCEYPMKQADDAQSYRELQCCYMCDLYWKRSDITVPEKTSERWLTYMERRRMRFLPQINFK
jgi:hypothetical protein